MYSVHNFIQIHYPYCNNSVYLISLAARAQPLQLDGRSLEKDKAVSEGLVPTAASTRRSEPKKKKKVQAAGMC